MEMAFIDDLMKDLKVGEIVLNDLRSFNNDAQ